MDNGIEKFETVKPQDFKSKESINIGSCIKIKNSQRIFQIIGLNQTKRTCWIREWPLNNKPYYTFELSMNKIMLSVICPLNQLPENK
tara:strand:- start:215 stop:475 length:261 start_codon:yes stop_codon:yes gene_type:complete